MSVDITFTKDNLDACFSRLAKEFRRRNGKSAFAEIILIGGAAILANYNFRNMTYDIDAIIRTTASMKESINFVGDEMGLPNGWLNSDFMKTKSYSAKLLQYSKFYKEFGHVLEVRTISGDYLTAMKLMSGRKYKNDISDIIGILQEEKERGTPQTLHSIQEAVCNLYGKWETIPQDSRDFITEIMKEDCLESLYKQYLNIETSTKQALLAFNTKYPNVTNENNVNDIIKKIET